LGIDTQGELGKSSRAGNQNVRKGVKTYDLHILNGFGEGGKRTILMGKKEGRGKERIGGGEEFVNWGGWEYYFFKEEKKIAKIMNGDRKRGGLENQGGKKEGGSGP